MGKRIASYYQKQGLASFSCDSTSVMVGKVTFICEFLQFEPFFNSLTVAVGWFVSSTACRRPRFHPGRRWRAERGTSEPWAWKSHHLPPPPPLMLMYGKSSALFPQQTLQELSALGFLTTSHLLCQHARHRRHHWEERPASLKAWFISTVTWIFSFFLVTVSILWRTDNILTPAWSSSCCVS